ncbi:MAG: mannose-1-phosphate guanylyltransferase/mannose-6-phosphate isomerase [Rhodospirillaceae bacterium]|nr:MAG: mannose-1-phosphate guanylyltransferase/mannose-6-phosphate isomerase [Rhodospirillaceae bacterium]
MAKKCTAAARITPVLLSGGIGTRLWPLSRASYPKQLYPLLGDRSLLQETALRVQDAALFVPPLIIGADAHRFAIAEQLRVLDLVPRRIVLEPEGRNTAPAIAVAAFLALQDDADALLLVLPSDHLVRDQKHFLEAVAIARKAAEGGSLVTFGIVPTAPETGYGYIQRGQLLKEGAACFEIALFVEKPDRQTAEKFLAKGDMYWNSGMFLFRADRFLEELDLWQPDIITAARKAVDGARMDFDFLRLDREAFIASPSVSIDYAVMERTSAAVVVPTDMGWSDVGSWTALQAVETPDAKGTVQIGDVFAEDVRNAYLRSEGPLLAVLGVENVVVVATKDAVLVIDRDRAQEVKAIVEKLKAAGREEIEQHLVVHRPWGSYQRIDSGERFQVKRITVGAGKKLSLQKHRHRAEHWVVVNGTALVTRGGESFLLRENESTYIPAGTVHRLENATDEPLHLIEVQSGSYLGEDDIVRIDDIYGRVDGGEDET